MKEIQLTQGKVALIDDEDYEYLNQWKWYVQKWNVGFYAVRNIRVNKKYGGYVSMHRLITNNYDKNLITDHINGNTLDNRKLNLRICTYSDNNKNRNIAKNNLSGYKGVSYINQFNKYKAQIGINKKTIYLGLFTDPIDAARAYNEAAIKYHGEFANINKID
tara:strand:- start:1428 stop:1913 length:486 start_codon:yes stop_codon:yes gene_type:complete